MANKDGEGIPLPDVLVPPESFAVTLCIPKNAMHVAAFFGALYQLTTWTSWERNGTNDAKIVSDVWWQYYNSWNTQITDQECEDEMGNCCTEPAITKRINPVTGIVEQSSNGGATWTPEAGGLQSYIVQPIPPVTSGVAETKCDAATNLSEQVQVWIDQTSNGFDTAVTLFEFGQLVVLAIIGAVLTVLTAGALSAVEVAILTALGAALVAVWGAGKAVFDAYWSTDVKDAILCAAFCHIGSDGSFTSEQFSAFWSQVNADLPASPAKMLFMGFLSSVGVAGVNAMAASGMSADADCSDCTECLSCPDKWRIRFDDPSLGTIDEVGENYIIASTTTAQPNGIYYISMWTGESAIDNCCMVDSVELISGAPEGFAGVLCGVDNLPVNLLLPACLWWFEPQGHTPYTIKINFNDCP